jgi:hypothetical protein
MFPSSAEDARGQRYCELLKDPGHVELVEKIVARLPADSAEQIVVKPNWVRHEVSPRFPISALVTNTGLLTAVLEACLDKYPRATSISVCDVPLQSCEWDLLVRQAALQPLIDRYAHYHRPRVQFLDLRMERYRSEDGFLTRQEQGVGDPLGYSEVVLDARSFLDPISDGNPSFRVSDYSPRETDRAHRKGHHRYLIANTVLASDLFINVPKLKTHQKSGITGALKNLVGINGKKSYLVHFRAGRLRNGGDEFPPSVPMAVVMQTRLREIFSKHSRPAFRVLKFGWSILRRLSDIEVDGTPENLSKQFYTAPGAWHGNDTIWRMIYDLNRIIRYAPAGGGSLSSVPGRRYMCVMDALIAGEGNGPLQPLPVKLGLVAIANDPFLADMSMAKVMGFDFRKIPVLAHYRDFEDSSWGAFDPERTPVSVAGQQVPEIGALPTLHAFLPPPGWAGAMEL